MASSQRRAQKAIRARGSQKCPHHQGQNVVYKCHDCNQLACITCVTSLHRRHDIDEIRDIMPDVKRKVQDFITSTEQDKIPIIREKITKLKADLSNNKRYYKNLISEIEKQREILKSEIDDLSNGLIKSCHDLEQGNENLLLKHSEDLQTKIDELNVQINECKNALQCANDVQVFDISNDIPSQYKHIMAPECLKVDFTTEKFNVEKLRSFLGKLTISRLKPTNWNEITQFIGFNVIKMCAASDNQIWVCLYSSTMKTFTNKMLLVDDKGSVQQTLDLDFTVLDFCLHETSRNIWLVSDDDNQIREFADSKSIVRFSTTDNALSICISREGSIYIGQEGGIVLYTQKGEVLCRTTGGDTPVMNPYSIAICPVSGNLAVVDDDLVSAGGKCEPHMVILSPTLKLHHQYHGNRPGHRSPFDPVRLSYSRKGQVVISDREIRSVILVDQKGEYLRTLYTDSESRTRAVCAMANGDVYVSHWNGSIIVLKNVL